jgi:hypothetical protein
MNPEIVNVWIDDVAVYVKTLDGDIYSEPFDKYPLLQCADSVQRAHFEYDNFGIRWEDIDEDLSFEGFFYNSAR